MAAAWDRCAQRLVRGTSVIILAFLHRHSAPSEAPDLLLKVQEGFRLLVCRIWVCYSLEGTHDLLLESCRRLACWYTILTPGPSHLTAIQPHGLIKCNICC